MGQCIFWSVVNEYSDTVQLELWGETTKGGETLCKYGLGLSLISFKGESPPVTQI